MAGRTMLASVHGKVLLIMCLLCLQSSIGLCLCPEPVGAAARQNLTLWLCHRWTGIVLDVTSPSAHCPAWHLA